jgi:hypothetical protein
MNLNPGISSKAFWDTNSDKPDYEANKDAIDAKVFEFGKWENMIEITRFYGEEQVKKRLLTTHSSFRIPSALSALSSKFLKNKWHVTKTSRITRVSSTDL